MNYRNGEEKIDKELDVSNILKSIRYQKILMKIFLDYN